MEEGKLIKENNFYMLEVQHERVGNMIIASSDHDFSKIINHPFKLSTKNCQTIENGYDLEELVDIETEKYGTLTPKSFRRGFLYGFQKAIEILGNKKFSDEDIINAHYQGVKDVSLDDFLKSIQKSEWDIQIEMKDVYDGLDEMAQPQYSKQPKLDADGCLILKPR